MNLPRMRWLSRFLVGSPAALEESFPVGLKGPNTSYTRFITLTTQRSGSSFLMQSLRSHPQIIAFGELFQIRRIGFNTPGFDNDSKALMRFRNRRPRDFLEWVLRRGYDQAVRAVGFKVHYNHLERPPLDLARAHLAALPGLRVLHLKRRNLLRAYLSTVVMSITRVTGIKSATDRQAPPQVTLAPSDCLRYFEHTRQRQTFYDRMFAEHDVSPVIYENLVADYAHETTRIQRFLQVVPTSLKARNLRQEERPLSVAITNYPQLRREFESTPWAEFFDD